MTTKIDGIMVLESHNFDASFLRYDFRCRIKEIRGRYDSIRLASKPLKSLKSSRDTYPIRHDDLRSYRITPLLSERVPIRFQENGAGEGGIGKC
jgi:hypothetical protein